MRINRKELTEMALRGLEIERNRVIERIEYVQSELQKRIETGATPKKSRLSPEARKRISLAQRKRWREHKKALAK